jgi:DNA-binding transcriptional LysR family regulator
MVVARSGSIREAAEWLNRSAPTLSRQIQLLERGHGTTLLVRSAQGIAMTAEREALREEAARWFASDTQVSQRLRAKTQSTRIRLRIGIMEGLIETLLPGLPARLKARFGAVELEGFSGLYQRSGCPRGGA